MLPFKVRRYLKAEAAGLQSLSPEIGVNLADGDIRKPFN